MILCCEQYKEDWKADEEEGDQDQIGEWTGTKRYEQIKRAGGKDVVTRDIILCNPQQWAQHSMNG